MGSARSTALDLTVARSEYEEAREQLVGWTEHQIESIPDTLTISEAQVYAQIYELRARLHGDAQHMSRYLCGIVTLRVKAASEHGTDPIGRCAELFKMHPNTLRYYVAAAKHTQCNLRYFDRWLKAGGFEKKQTHLIEFTRVLKDRSITPADVAAEIVKRRVEEAAEDIDEMADPDEQESASILLTEAAGRYLDSSGDDRKLYKTIEPPPSFLAFLASCYCIGCGVPPPDKGRHDTHHVKHEGTAQESSDWAQVPLCRMCHTFVHAGDYLRFRHETGVDMRVALLRVWHLWIAGEELYLPNQLI